MSRLDWRGCNSQAGIKTKNKLLICFPIISYGKEEDLF